MMVDQLAEFAARTGDALSSPGAVYIYSWIAFVTIVAGSVLFGALYYKRAESRLDDDLRAVLIKRGPRPTREEAIRARKEARNRVLKTFLRQIATSAIFIILVPFAGLIVISLFRSWFFGSDPIFVSRSTGEIVTDPGTVQLILYFLDHLLKGLFFDVMEVFRIQFSALQNANDALVYSGFLVLFRMLVDLYAVGLVLTGSTTIAQLFAPLAQTERQAARQEIFE